MPKPIWIVMIALPALWAQDGGISAERIRAHDRFLVCSDGLCGTLKDQDMLGLMLGNATLESVCTKLIELAVARGAEDDITVILAEVNGEGAPAVTGSERVTSQSPEAFATTLDARPSALPTSG